VPATHGLPLGRFTRTELHRLVIERGVTDASATTIWRWLHEDAIKPWQVRSWLFARDPDFQAKAGRVLHLYARRIEGKRLRPDELVISADEKSQLQALGRRHPTLAPAPGRPSLCEFEYVPRRHLGLPRRLGRLPRQPLRPARGADRDRALRSPRRAGDDDRALRLSAARLLDCRQRLLARGQGVDRAARGRVEEPAPDPSPRPCLLAQPDRALLLDRPAQGADPERLRLLEELRERLLGFQVRYAEIARPFEWTFTRADLDRVLARVASRESQLKLAA
jgi:hypothetical protein